MSSSASSVTVTSLSPEVFKKEGDNKRWEVSVLCSDTSDPKFIRQVVGEEQWCTEGDSKRCSNDKLELANRACDNDVAADETAPKSTTNIEAKSLPDKTSLIREKIEIEEALIQIQQRKLELRKRELNLQKQKMGLNPKGKTL